MALACLIMMPSFMPTPTALAARRLASPNGPCMNAFHRADDILQLRPCSTEDIVNVLGRWTTYSEWECGELIEIDKLFDEDGNEREKLPQLSPGGLDVLGGRVATGDSWKSNYSSWKPPKFDATQDPMLRRTLVAKSAQRRGFCLRRGLCQRAWFKENVGNLPFTDERLARSIGCSVAELAVRPVDELAADVVFDAIVRSRSGICERAECDEQRAKYQRATDGGFDADTFKADLDVGRLNIVKSFALFPGSLIAIQAYVFFRLDGPSAVLAWVEGFASLYG